MQFPKLNHIVLNSGLGLKSLLPSGLWTVLLGLESITSRRPLITRSKKSIDQFKLRVHTPLGCKLTLRSSSSFFFFHRLVHFVLPRLEDLSFLSSSFLPPSSDLLYPRLSFSPSVDGSSFANSSPLAFSGLSSLPLSPFYKRFSFFASSLPRQHSASLSKLLSFFRFLRFHTFFLPFFKPYFTLPFSDSLVTFFLDHSSFHGSYRTPFSSSLSSSDSVTPSPNVFLSKGFFQPIFPPSPFGEKGSKRGLLKHWAGHPKRFPSRPHLYAFSFGLSDFFTSFSTDFDKFHSSYGLDITFVIRFSNHRFLSHPFYFLSFFQFPLVP